MADRIVEKIEAYAANPASQRNNVERLKGMEGIIRLRAGDWRVIFEIQADALEVIDVLPRGSAYRGRPS
jgi:mRNA interferase RelE/StbE